MATREEAIRMFWAKVNKDGPTDPRIGSACWVWTGARVKAPRSNDPGYGVIAAAGGMTERLAHRRAWEIENGKPELCVLHRCDNRACVRLDHLFLGTYTDNNRDMVSKGRHKTPFSAPNHRGEQHRLAKMTDAVAATIPARYAAGETQQSIAQDIGVSQSTISLVLLGKHWKHVTGIRAPKTRKDRR